jgi:hypothetical protein
MQPEPSRSFSSTYEVMAPLSQHVASLLSTAKLQSKLFDSAIVLRDSAICQADVI